jgi:hypothetical protein
MAAETNLTSETAMGKQSPDGGIAEGCEGTQTATEILKGIVTETIGANVRTIQRKRMMGSFGTQARTMIHFTRRETTSGWTGKLDRLVRTEMRGGGGPFRGGGPRVRTMIGVHQLVVSARRTAAREDSRGHKGWGTRTAILHLGKTGNRSPVGGGMTTANTIHIRGDPPAGEATAQTAVILRPRGPRAHMGTGTIIPTASHRPEQHAQSRPCHAIVQTSPCVAEWRIPARGARTMMFRRLHARPVAGWPDDTIRTANRSRGQRDQRALGRAVLPALPSVREERIWTRAVPGTVIGHRRESVTPYWAALGILAAICWTDVAFRPVLGHVRGFEGRGRVILHTNALSRYWRVTHQRSLFFSTGS